jgi:hypothetical protein
MEVLTKICGADLIMFDVCVTLKPTSRETYMKPRLLETDIFL